MRPRSLLSWLFTRPGHRPAGIHLACGYGKRSASTGMKPRTGTNVQTRPIAVDSSFTATLGTEPVGVVIPLMPHAASSYIGLSGYGETTADRGASGQPDTSAGSDCA